MLKGERREVHRNSLGPSTARGTLTIPLSPCNTPAIPCSPAHLFVIFPLFSFLSLSISLSSAPPPPSSLFFPSSPIFLFRLSPLHSSLLPSFLPLPFLHRTFFHSIFILLSPQQIANIHDDEERRERRREEGNTRDSPEPQSLFLSLLPL